MMAEGQGRIDDARRLFAQAWAQRTDDFDACVAAHYVARHQDSPAERLRWNREALSRAEAVPDDRVRGYFPSLYLNLGRSYEDVGNLNEARRTYELAAERVGDLLEDGYGAMVRRGIAEGRRRTT
jgi:tetratricopeptide (TPR) repeat protein